MEGILNLATPQDMLWITPLAAILTQWTKHTKIGSKMPTQIWAIVMTIVAFAIKTVIAQPELRTNPKIALIAAASVIIKGIIAASTASNTIAFVNRVKDKGFAGSGSIVTEEPPEKYVPVSNAEPIEDNGASGGLELTAIPGTGQMRVTAALPPVEELIGKSYIILRITETEGGEG